MIAAALVDKTYPKLLKALDQAADQRPDSFVHQYACGLGYLGVMRGWRYGDLKVSNSNLLDPHRIMVRLERAKQLDKRSGSSYAALYVFATLHRPTGIGPAEQVRFDAGTDPKGRKLYGYHTISDKPLRDYLRDLILAGLKVNAENPRLQYLNALRGGAEADAHASAKAIEAVYAKFDSRFWRPFMLDSLYVRVDRSGSATMRKRADTLRDAYVKQYGKSPLFGPYTKPK